jgi:hypothetical protein
MASKIYFFAGGGLVTASNPEQFVKAMHRTSRKPRDTDLRYMQDVSERCYLYSDAYIRTTSADDFLQDLIDNDFVFVVNTN